MLVLACRARRAGCVGRQKPARNANPDQGGGEKQCQSLAKRLHGGGWDQIGKVSSSYICWNASLALEQNDVDPNGMFSFICGVHLDYRCVTTRQSYPEPRIALHSLSGSLAEA